MRCCSKEIRSARAKRPAQPRAVLWQPADSRAPRSVGRCGAGHRHRVHPYLASGRVRAYGPHGCAGRGCRRLATSFAYGAVQHALRQAVQRAPHVTTVQASSRHEIDAEAQRVRTSFVTPQSPASAMAQSARHRRRRRAQHAVGRSRCARIRPERNRGQCRDQRARIGHIAYERFTPDGPLALLPREHGYAMVWTVPRECCRAICARSRSRHLSLNCSRRSAIARASSPARTQRAAVSAHSAGGENPGSAAHGAARQRGASSASGCRPRAQSRAARCVGARAVPAQSEGDMGSADVVGAFQRRRRSDRAGAVLVTDALVRVFSNDHLALRWLRGCGLTFLDSLPPVKRAFMQQMTFGRPY